MLRVGLFQHLMMTRPRRLMKPLVAIEKCEPRLVLSAGTMAAMVSDWSPDHADAATDGYATESAMPVFDYADYASAYDPCAADSYAISADDSSADDDASTEDSSGHSRWNRSADDYFAHVPGGASSDAASDRGAGHGRWSDSATGPGRSDRAGGHGLAIDDVDSPVDDADMSYGMGMTDDVDTNYDMGMTDDAGLSDDAADTASFGVGGASVAALAGPPPPAAASSNGPGMIEVGANELFIYGISVEVTSAGVEIHGKILHGGSSLSGFTVAFTGAFSGTATTASDGSFDFIYYGSDSGLVEANASGGGLSSNPYTFFV